MITKSMNSDEKNTGLETEIWVTVPVFSLCDHEQTLPSLSLNFSSCYRVDFFEAQTYIQLCVYIVCTFDFHVLWGAVIKFFVLSC